jgi:hypothetical protein
MGQRHLRSSYNKVHWDFEELGKIELSEIGMEMGYIVVDDDLKVIQLDPTLYDVSFESQDHVDVVTKDG